MGRKVFISVLGTSLYGKCKYVDDQTGFKSSDAVFVQQATLECIGATKWPADAVALILLTEKARNDNWNKSITQRTNRATQKSVEYPGLEKILIGMNLPFNIVDVTIPNGKNETEMWQIFQILFDRLEDGDELYFDLTHSFRYLPMLLLVLGNYAKFLKHVTIKHIYYGNYDARNEETEETPIVDLLPLSSLQDWTFASANYLENGNVDQLSALSKMALRPILANASGTNQNASNLSKYIKVLQSVVDSMTTCRGISIMESKEMKSLKETSENINEVILPPLVPVFEKINDSFRAFEPSRNILNGFTAAKWCLDNNMYQQSITILQESITSLVCLCENLSVEMECDRTMVNRVFKIKIDSLPEEKWEINDKSRNETEAELTRKKEIIKRLLAKPLIDDLASSFKVITDMRNDFNHSGFRQNPVSALKIKSRIKERVDFITNYVRENADKYL